MILILFVIVFIIISDVILKISNHVLKNNSFSIGDNLNSGYITTYVKGSTRGSMGLLESNSMLESKRVHLKRRNSKF